MLLSVEFLLELRIMNLNFEFLLDWNDVFMVWKLFWEIYFIGFGLLFLGVVLFFCICVVKIKYCVRGMILGNYFFVVCLMLMVFSFLWILFFMLDLYELYMVLNLFVLLIRILFVIGYLCLILVLLFIYFVFLEVNKFRFVFCWF